MSKFLPVILCALGLLVPSAPAPAYAKCSCENQLTLDALTRQERAAALRLPSEADRTLARSFRMKGLPLDAAQWYESAATTAAKEYEEASAKAKQLPMPGISVTAMQEMALHSA